MFKFLFSAVFFLVGLLFAASLVVAVALLMAVWALRAGWARITGKPVTPWVMRFDPRAGFQRFRDAGRQPEASAADVVSARACGETAGVTDVRARPITRVE